MPTPPVDPPHNPLAFVCWRGGDGARETSAPLDRQRAEALVEAYAAAFPRQRCWVELVPWGDGPRSPARRVF